VRLRVDIGPDCSIGPGKIALLEQIERSGSLSEAGRVLKMSYRRAWLLLDDLNRTLGQPVTTASVGGAGGGGARITPFGRQVVAAFRDIERAAAAAAAQQLEWLLQAGVGAAEHTAPRRAVNRSLGRARANVAGPAADGAAGGLSESDGAKPQVESARRGKRGRAVKPP
jgi:molybdate transport system regulatory protein